MSRLLFAAARGARIEFFGRGDLAEWQDTTAIPTLPWPKSWEQYYRIYPDDEHLQYGPISSALRNFALYGESRTFEDHMAAAALKQEYCGCSFVPADPVVLGNLALFLAEALADEGL